MGRRADLTLIGPRTVGRRSAVPLPSRPTPAGQPPGAVADCLWMGLPGKITDGGCLLWKPEGVLAVDLEEEVLG